MMSRKIVGMHSCDLQLPYSGIKIMEVGGGAGDFKVLWQCQSATHRPFLLSKSPN